MALSLTVGGEMETSKELNEPGTASSRRTTIFNMTLDDVTAAEHENEEWRKYETALQQEMKEWRTMWYSTLQELKRTNAEKLRIDVSILPPEKAAYLKETPDMQMYLRQAMIGRVEAHKFLKQDYAEMCQMQQNLKEVCEFHAKMAKTNKWRKHRNVDGDVI